MSVATITVLDSTGATQTINATPDGVFDASLTSSWAAATPVNAAGYSTAYVQIVSLSGGDSITLLGNLGGGTVTLIAQNLTDFSTTSSITANGIYAVSAAGSLSYTKTGTASTPTLYLMLKR